jgi:PEP-CTERM motif
MKPKNILTTAILAATGLALSTSAQAQNPGFANGDLIMAFRAVNGTGSDRTVMVSLGNTATVFRDSNVNNINLDNIVNVNSILTTEFGMGWYDNTNLFWGAAGSWSNENPPAALLNGDPNQTIYMSKARTLTIANENLASSTLNTPGTSAHTTAATQIQTLNNTFEAQLSGQATVLNTVAGTWEEYNVTNSGTFVQSTAWGAYTGGIQQRFTAGSYGTFSNGAVEGALDIYRAQFANDFTGQFDEGGALRAPQFQGFLTIDQAGNVDFTVTPVPEPSSIGLFAAGSVLVGLIRRRRVRNS